MTSQEPRHEADKAREETHPYPHVLRIEGVKQRYFKFLESLEDPQFRKDFQANPPGELRRFGIEFDDLTPEIVKDNLPDPARIREYRLALEEDAEDAKKKKILKSHAHLVFDFLTGQSPLTRQRGQ